MIAVDYGLLILVQRFQDYNYWTYISELNLQNMKFPYTVGANSPNFDCNLNPHQVNWKWINLYWPCSTITITFACGVPGFKAADYRGSKSSEL